VFSLSSQSSSRGHKMPCPKCGKEILRRKMPNNEYVYFESKWAITRIKHHCFYIGQGIPKARDDKTLDLLDPDAD